MRPGSLKGTSMRVHPECFPCFINQTVIALKLATRDQALMERVLKGVLPEVGATDMSKSPAHATTFIHRKIRALLGADPFEGVKDKYNALAIGLYDGLKQQVAASSDPLQTATRLAIAGNIIDFGILTEINIDETIARATNGPIERDDFAAFEEAVSKVDEILYLTDNSGEIVFDRVLIETLKETGKEVTAVVKGESIINDCTMKDARDTGLTGVCEVVDNGSDCVGTIMSMVSEDMKRRFERAPLVISKGQGNFETLMDENKDGLFFLFQAKCDVVGRELQMPRGSMLLMEN